MIEQSININVASPGMPVSIYTKQYDSNSREIVSTLWDGSAPYAMPAGASAMLRFRKPDGTGGLYDTDSHGNAITIADNVVTIPLDDQVMTAAGKVMAEVDIYGTNNMRIATFDFWVYVSPTVCEDSAITSSDYYNVLTQQIANALAAAAAAAASATDAWDNATLAQSWAIGGTDTRTGEDTDNAHYWAQQAEAATTGCIKYTAQTLTDTEKEQARANIGAISSAPVTSVFGRTGAITAAAGDYNLSQVGGSNDNLLDNPSFAVNQRGYTTYIVGTGTDTTTTHYLGTDGGYTADRWKLTSGSMTVLADGVTLNGTMVQIREQAVGKTTTASVRMVSGTATISYDDTTKTCTVTSSGGKIGTAKLEVGSVSTIGNDPPADYATELAKCQRYFYRFVGTYYSGYFNNSWFGSSVMYPVEMRVNPVISNVTSSIGDALPATSKCNNKCSSWYSQNYFELSGFWASADL